MKKIILALLVVVTVSSSIIGVVRAKEQKCYTHIKKWHACPIQPSH